MNLTFIGNGNMAKALIKGLVKTCTIEVLGRNEKSLNILQEELPQIITRVIKNEENINGKNIILCVKPYSLPDLAPKLIGKADAIYSVLAGTSIDNLSLLIKSKNYIRTMPNLGASYLKSMTTITGDEELKHSALDIFNKIGRSLWLNTENELDIATGVAGSGPAYLALIAESLADGAVKAGLKREDSQILVAGLFNSFAPLIENENPALIKDGVMSPGGTTAAGYGALESGNVRSSMINAVEYAYNKALELKEKN